MNSSRELVTLLTAVALGLAQLVGGVAALLFGRKLTWLWVVLAAYGFVSRALLVALYRETDNTRTLIGLAGGAVAAVIAMLVMRRFPKLVFAVGGFLAAGLTMIQLFGPLLDPAPDWMVIGILLAAGFAGGAWAVRFPETAGIILSALVGATVLTAFLVDLMDIDEASRFQVQMVLALSGMGFQFWRQHRASVAAQTSLEEGSGA